MVRFFTLFLFANLSTTTSSAGLVKNFKAMAGALSCRTILEEVGSGPEFRLLTRRESVDSTRFLTEFASQMGINPEGNAITSDLGLVGPQSERSDLLRFASRFRGLMAKIQERTDNHPELSPVTYSRLVRGEENIQEFLRQLRGRHFDYYRGHDGSISNYEYQRSKIVDERFRQHLMAFEKTNLPWLYGSLDFEAPKLFSVVGWKNMDSISAAVTVSAFLFMIPDNFISKWFFKNVTARRKGLQDIDPEFMVKIPILTDWIYSTHNGEPELIVIVRSKTYEPDRPKGKKPEPERTPIQNQEPAQVIPLKKAA